ncbi:hypothetical protein [Desulfovibrio gilichinskyi]|uniref:Uncharacterized protein n=1 Tax=Desulfovibrio gilichinskyi TaxID=1519643 RepID=A0A1X7CHV5_9BACT|nr:hypothetical protein [Desulfovibrio gilichinskyi]SME96631.1 hypothetical protein SAMN06295933_0905 [Desulfovibrio gilichinskyi]
MKTIAVFPNSLDSREKIVFSFPELDSSLPTDEALESLPHGIYSFETEYENKNCYLEIEFGLGKPDAIEFRIDDVKHDSIVFSILDN